MSIESLKEQARSHEQREDWNAALNLYLEAIREMDEADQSDISLYNRVGDIETRLGKANDAADHYLNAVALYVEAELPNNAIAVCKKVIRNVPDRADVHLKMGQIRASQGFLTDARQSFLTYAEQKQLAGDLEEAFRALIEFADLAPDDTEIRLALAAQLHAHDRTNEAVEQLIQARGCMIIANRGEEAREVEARIAELAPEVSLPDEAEVRASSGAEPATEDFGHDGDALALEDVAATAGFGEADASVAVDGLEGFETTHLGAAEEEEAPAATVSEDVPEEDGALALEGVVDLGSGFNLEDSHDPSDAAEGEAPEQDETGGLDLEAAAELESLADGFGFGDEDSSVDALAEDDAEDADDAGLDLGAAFLSDDSSADQGPVESADVEALSELDDLASVFDTTDLPDDSGLEVGGEAESLEGSEAEFDVSELGMGGDVSDSAEAADDGLVSLDDDADLDDQSDAALPFMEFDEEEESGTTLLGQEADLDDALNVSGEGATEDLLAAEDTTDLDDALGFGDAEADFGRDEAGDDLLHAGSGFAASTEGDPLGGFSTSGDAADTAGESHVSSGALALGAATEAPADLLEQGIAALHAGESEGVTLLEQAYAGLAAEGQFESAMQAVRELITHQPAEVEYHQRMVECAFQLNDKEILSGAYVDLARCLEENGDAEQARAVYQQVLGIDPQHEEALAAVGSEVAEAAEATEVAASEDYVDLGALIFDEDEEEKTTRWFVEMADPSGDDEADFAKMLSQFKDKVAEHIEADDVRAHYDLGTAYREMGLVDEAIAEFQQALRASGDHLPTYEILGQCFMEKGQYEVAIRSMSRALDVTYEVEDELLGIYYYLGAAHQTLGNVETATEFYERIFSLDINFRDVTERLRALR